MKDIFISYKQSDENGNPTRDSQIALDLYDKLKEKGYNTFCAKKSLKEIGSSRYKSDIDSALDESKVMVVVLTNSEYAESTWVKYEWDGFFNDVLSNIKPSACLFTYTEDVSIHSLPRTLRGVQNFKVGQDEQELISYIEKCLEKNGITAQRPEPKEEKTEQDDKKENKSIFEMIRYDEITPEDIQEVLDLEAKVYDEDSEQKLEDCLKYFAVNPEIYMFMRHKESGKIVANVDIAPITDDCYEKLRSGHFTDLDLTPEMILSYDMPYLYNIYFSSIVVDKEFRNTFLFLTMFNAVVEKFVELGEREIYAKRMIADAVTPEGEKFCKMFGMKKVKESDRHSKIYEVCLMPPEFRVSSKATKKLYEYYSAKYEEVKDFMNLE